MKRPHLRKYAPRLPKIPALIFLIVGISMIVGAVPYVSPPISRPKTAEGRLQNLPLIGAFIGFVFVIIGGSNLIARRKRP